MNKKINLLNFDRAAMELYFLELGEKKFRAHQVIKWIYQSGIKDFAQMMNLSTTLREKLSLSAEIRAPEIALEQKSKDGTRKWVVRLEDGNCIETVFIPEAGRGTLCVSSQVGCALNCSFCSTAQQGFSRNLTTAEIIGQVWLAQKQLGQLTADPQTPVNKVTNVVMMGMGEPLLNYDNVVPAMSLMLDDLAFGLSKRRVTLSTSGVVPAMKQLSEDSAVALAVSLHAPNDSLRNELVPINKKYPLAQLMAVCRHYFKNEKKRYITMEYVMLAGINDQPIHAQELIKLLKDIPAKVNLIPFNPFPNTHYQCSSRAVIDQFRDTLMAAGLTAITRRTRGDDIDAACGQLVGDVNDKTRRSERLKQKLENIAVHSYRDVGEKT